MQIVKTHIITFHSQHSIQQLKQHGITPFKQNYPGIYAKHRLLPVQYYTLSIYVIYIFYNWENNYFYICYNPIKQKKGSTLNPSPEPTPRPSFKLQTANPTPEPTPRPSIRIITLTTNPTPEPTPRPTKQPKVYPTRNFISNPSTTTTKPPTKQPTRLSQAPTSPTYQPTDNSRNPTTTPTVQPTTKHPTGLAPDLLSLCFSLSVTGNYA